MGRLVEFDDDELELTTEMLREYRAAVLDGSISGYGQTKEEELADTERLLEKFERAAL